MNFAHHYDLRKIDENFFGSIVIVIVSILGAFLCNYFAADFFASFDMGFYTVVAVIAVSAAMVLFLIYRELFIAALILSSLLAIFFTTQDPVFIILSTIYLAISVLFWLTHVSIKYEYSDKIYEKNDRDYRERATVDY